MVEVKYAFATPICQPYLLAGGGLVYTLLNQANAYTTSVNAAPWRVGAAISSVLSFRYFSGRKIQLHPILDDEFSRYSDYRGDLDGFLKESGGL